VDVVQDELWSQWRHYVSEACILEVSTNSEAQFKMYMKNSVRSRAKAIWNHIPDVVKKPVRDPRLIDVWGCVGLSIHLLGWTLSP
jgi:hypothetical protein